MSPISKSKPKIISAAAVILLVAIFIITRQKNSTVPATTKALNNTTGTSTEPVISNKNYKDGTYTANGEYSSPAGNEVVEVSLTLKDGIITVANFTADSKNSVSKSLQGKFATGYQEVVVGKPIDTLSLTVVNGSSLTPKGFMDAVNKIKAEAQS